MKNFSVYARVDLTNYRYRLNYGKWFCESCQRLVPHKHGAVNKKGWKCADCRKVK